MDRLSKATRRGVDLAAGVLCALALIGCQVDYELGDGTGLGSGSNQPGDPGGGGGNGGGGNGGGGNNSGRNNPWGNLDPGDLPEAYFAVAYIDWNQPYTEPYGCYCYSEPVRYAIIDLRGHVLSEFELPSPDPANPDTYAWIGGHRDFLPAGPGQFVAVSGFDYWFDSCDALWGDCAEWSWDTDWYAWRADGVTGETTPVARGTWDDQGYVTHLIEADRYLHHGSWGWYGTSLAMQPLAPDDLTVWSGSGACVSHGPGLPDDVVQANVVDREVPDLMWGADEVLPSWLLFDGQVITPLLVEEGVDGDGLVGKLFGIQASPCQSNAAPSTWLAGWREDWGVGWAAPVTDLYYPYDVEYSALDGGAALYVPPADEDGNHWKLIRRGLEISGTLPPELLWPRVGPLLDPAGPSFVLLTSNEDSSGDEIVFMHQGQEVWRIDGLKFGLEKRDVYIRDLMLIPPVPEEE